MEKENVGFPKRFESKPEIEIDAQALMKRLKEIKINETIEYAELDELLGRDVREDATTAFYRAKDRLLETHHMIFQPEEGIRLRRLTDEDIIARTARRRKRIQRQSKIGARELACVDFDKLEKEEQKKHNTEMATMGVLSLFSGQKEHKKLLNQVSITGPMPVGRVLEFFSQESNKKKEKER